MPTIPDYTALGQTPIPSRRTRLTPESGFELEPAKGIEAISQSVEGIGEVFQKVKLRQDTTAAEDAYNKLIERRMDLTRGDDGFLQKKGADAVRGELVFDYANRLEDSVTGISEGLANDEQREMFRKRASISKLQYKEDMLRHISSEQDKYDTEVFGNTVELETRNASERYNDPNSINLSRSRIDGVIDQRAEKLGWSPEQVKNAKFKAGSDVHIGVIGQALDQKQSDKAMDWFKSHKKEIDPNQHGEVEALIEKAGLLELGQSVADDSEVKNLTERDALAEARKKYSGEKEKAVVAAIKERFGEQKIALDRDQNEASEEAWDVYAKTKDLKQVPISVLDRMDGKARIVLEKQAKDDVAGTGIKTGGGDYYALRTIIRDEPEKFSTLNLNQYHLAPGDRKELIKLQTDPPAISVARTKQQIFDQGALALGLEPKEAKEASNAGEEVRSYYRRLDAEAAAFQAINGKPPTTKDMSEIVDHMAIQVIRKRDWWWDKKTPAGVAEVEGVPTEMLDELAAAVQSAGQPVTEENVKKLYDYQLQRAR